MNIEQAKMILSAYSGQPVDELDSDTLEALTLARQDPELQEWLRQQDALDPLLERIYTEIPIPDGLEKQLLDTVRSDRPVAVKRRVAPWLAAVAAIIVLGFGAVFLVKNEGLIQSAQETVTGVSPDSFDQFRDGMAYYIKQVYFQLDLKSADLPSIEAWLEENKTPSYERLPSSLAARVPLGCKQLQWHGKAVSLVCFESGDGGIVHLFIMDKAVADPRDYADIDTVAVAQGLETGGWTSDEKVYLLVGSGPDVDIEFALG